VYLPATTHSAAGNRVYADLVASWIEAGFTLRYTGGMVPDVHHIIAKGGEGTQTGDGNRSCMLCITCAGHS
jgi:hypothetical protein